MSSGIEGSVATGPPATLGALRWVIVAVAVACLVAMLAYARGEPGDDGRTPGPDETSAALAPLRRGAER